MELRCNCEFLSFSLLFVPPLTVLRNVLWAQRRNAQTGDLLRFCSTVSFKANYFNVRSVFINVSSISMLYWSKEIGGGSDRQMAVTNAFANSRGVLDGQLTKVFRV